MRVTAQINISCVYTYALLLLDCEMIHSERDGVTEGYRDIGMERERDGATEGGRNIGT